MGEGHRYLVDLGWEESVAGPLRFDSWLILTITHRLFRHDKDSPGTSHIGLQQSDHSNDHAHAEDPIYGVRYRFRV